MLKVRFFAFSGNNNTAIRRLREKIRLYNINTTLQGGRRVRVQNNNTNNNQPPPAAAAAQDEAYGKLFYIMWCIKL